MILVYFYDSYAVIEYLRGNGKYSKYFDSSTGVITHMNLVEIHHTLMRLFPEREADTAAGSLEKLVVIPKLHNIIFASKFRLKNKRLDMSYADCLGYAVAKDMKIKFLTGDKAFKGFENVEFVQ